LSGIDPPAGGEMKSTACRYSFSGGAKI